MGCGASADDDEFASAREFAYQAQYIGIAKWDDFFDKVGKAAAIVGDLKAGAVDKMHKIYYYMDLYKLKTFDPCDAFKIFLWTLSAQTGGDLKGLLSTKPDDIKIMWHDQMQLNPKYFLDCQEEALSIKVEGYDIDKEMSSVIVLLVFWVAALIKGVFKIPELIKNFSGMIDDAQKMKETIEEDVKSVGGDDPFAKARAIANVGKGINSMVSLLSNMTKLGQELPRYLEGAQKIAKEYKQIIETADEFGKKAISLQITSFHDILDQLHPGPFITNKEANDLVLAKGWNQGKRKRGQPESNMIIVEYRKIGFPKYDDLFQKQICPLAQKINRVYSMVQKPQDEVFYVSDAYILQQPSMLDAFWAWLQNISMLDYTALDVIQFEDEKQADKVTRNVLRIKLSDNNRWWIGDQILLDMVDKFQDWYEGLKHRSSTFKQDFKEFNEIAKKAEQIKKDFPKEIAALQNKVEAQTVITNGLDMLIEGNKLAEKLNANFDKMIKDADVMKEKLDSEKENAKKIGEQAKTDKITELYHFIVKYNNNPKATPDQLKRLEKELKIKRRRVKVLPKK